MKLFLIGSLVITLILGADLLIFREQIPMPEGMVYLPAGQFTMGSDRGLPDEYPAHEISLSEFWIDRHEVTNAEFARFVEATDYVTSAEQHGDSLVFTPVLSQSATLLTPADWWQIRDGANWRQPNGKNDSIASRMTHPVVQVSYSDAQAYCDWQGKALPTEAQFEYAARGGQEGMMYSWGEQPLHRHSNVANHWQGEFPRHNANTDGHAGTAPVGSFPANPYGLYDITGNVWEWVSDWYHPRYYQMSPAHNPQGVEKAQSLDPAEPNLPKRGIRGGSFLCSENYCAGFRVSARMPADPATSTNHTGFRCVINGRQSPLSRLTR